MNSRWAMLVRVTAVNSVEMLSPKKKPAGATSFQVRRSGNGRRITSITTHQIGLSR